MYPFSRFITLLLLRFKLSVLLGSSGVDLKTISPAIRSAFEAIL